MLTGDESHISQPCIKMQAENDLISAPPVVAVCLVTQSAQSLSAEVISRQQFGGEAEDRGQRLFVTV